MSESQHEDPCVNHNSSSSPTISQSFISHPIHESVKMANPLDNFEAFFEGQKELLITESDAFFKRHCIRIRKTFLPTKLPDWAKSPQDIINSDETSIPFASIYRHKHFLKCRILRNWSYIETPWNSSSMKRNNGIPFDLRPLTKEISKQLDLINEDLTDPEFTGILLTLNSSVYKHTINNKDIYASKILAGGLVECLSTNERCIKCLWVHPDLSQHSSKLLLQAFLPRLILESFSMDLDNKCTNAKFTYAMHNDMDLFPRQCWLLLASAKKMCLPRHYEPSSFEEHLVDLDYGGFHTDINEKNFRDLYQTYGKPTTTRNVQCLCRKKKEQMPTGDQAWLDRLIGCTEIFMSLMLPKKSERQALGLYVREGWRDMIPDNFEEGLYLNIMRLLPGYGKGKIGITPHISVHDKHNSRNGQNSKDIGNNTYAIPSGSLVDIKQEWCELKKDDIADITSDTEYSMRNPKM